MNGVPSQNWGLALVMKYLGKQNPHFGQATSSPQTQQASRETHYAMAFTAYTQQE